MSRQEETMLLKAILTTAVLGTSTVAMAQTYQPYDADHPRAYDQTTVVRARFARRMVLARDLTLAADRQSSFIRIDPRANVTRIRLELTRGRAYVDSVFVTYTGGYQETFAVRKMISPRMPRLVIDLPAAGTVSGVAINSSPMRAARGGGHRVLRPATVNVIGVRRSR
jgi:hypothetical protein